MTGQAEREERDVERSLDEERVRQESEAAAEEAGRIGGRGGAEGEAEENRAPAEFGGGEAEGFEQAEDDLIESASHGDDAPDPTSMAGEAEAEDAGSEYGEADEERVSELDPDERTD